MKLANRILLTCLCAVACVLGATHWLHTRPVHAQQSSNYYDDGTFYISASVEVDSNYNLYLDSYMEVEFDDYEDIDEIEVDAYVDEDRQIFASDFSDGDDWDPAEVSLQSNAPIAPGHEYGLESDGYACFDDGEGDCDTEYIGSTYTSVNVAAPPPQIVSLSTYSVHQGDQGTLTITGSNFVENSADHLTINFSGSGNPFTLTGTPSSNAATFSYNFSGYPAGSYTLSVANNEGTSNNETFTIITNAPQNRGADPCAVTSNPQTGYSSIVTTGVTGGSGMVTVSFSGAAFAAVAASVTYGPNSTPNSIAAHIAALITKNYYRYGLGAKAFGSIVVYSGNTTLGTVSNVATGSSFTTTTSSTAATEAENACHNAPPPPLSMYAVAYSAYIPVDHVYGPPVDQCTYVAPGLGDIGVVHIYHGDAYHNTYRVTQAISLNFMTAQASGYFPDAGITESYGFGSPYNGQAANLSSQDDDPVYYDQRTNTGTPDCYLRDAIGKASTAGWSISPSVLNTDATVGMSGSGQNPLSLPFGSIDWSMTTYIDAGSSTGHVDYQHTCYPAHQIKVANTTLYLYTPSSDDSIYVARCLTESLPEVTGTSPTITIH